MLRRSSSRTVRVTVSVREDDYDRANLQHITNVCNIIRQPAYPFVGFCLDDVGCLKSYASLRAATEHVQQSLTLEALLPHFKEKLPIAEVYGLAITLVSSIFQLSHTPWLDTKWNKKNILFSRAGNSLSLTVDLRYPYLAKHFYSGELHSKPKFEIMAADEITRRWNSTAQRCSRQQKLFEFACLGDYAT